MAAFVPQVLLQIRWQIRIQPVRYRKINIQKPRPSHFVRARVESLCSPILPKLKERDPATPLHEICNVGFKFFKKEEIYNPYEHLLAKEIRNWFNHSKMIAIFHRNSVRSSEKFEMQLLLKKKGMTYREYGKVLMEKVVTGTELEPILPLFCSHTVVVYSEEDRVADLMKILKRMPKIVLMAAVVDGRFMSRSELESYAILPDLQTARAGLVATLNSAAQGVVHKLNQHQTTLVQHLKQHIELSQTTPTASHDTATETVSQNTESDGAT